MDGPVVLKDGSVCVVGGTSLNLSHISADGAVVWQKLLSYPSNAALSKDSSTVYTKDDPATPPSLKLRARRTSDGSTIWSYDTGIDPFGLPPPSIPSPPWVNFVTGDIYYIDDIDYTVVCVSSSGAFKWRSAIATNNTFGSCSPDGQHVYIIDGGIAAVDSLKAADGSLEWQSAALSGGPGDLSAPIVSSAGLIYLYSNAFGARFFYAINPNGSTKWAYDATADSNSAHSISVIQGDLLVNAFFDLYRHAASDGHRIWTASTSQAAGYSANISVDKDGNIYTGDAQQLFPILVNPRLLFYDADGNLLKTVAMYPVGEIAIGDNRIYFVDWATGNLVCLS